MARVKPRRGDPHPARHLRLKRSIETCGARQFRGKRGARAKRNGCVVSGCFVAVHYPQTSQVHPRTSCGRRRPINLWEISSLSRSSCARFTPSARAQSGSETRLVVAADDARVFHTHLIHTSARFHGTIHTLYGWVGEDRTGGCVLCIMTRRTTTYNISSSKTRARAFSSTRVRFEEERFDYTHIYIVL